MRAKTCKTEPYHPALNKLFLEALLRRPSERDEMTYSWGSRDTYITFLAAEAVFLLVCSVVWIGTWYSVGADHQFIQWYTVAAVVVIAFTFAGVYRVLDTLLGAGKPKNLELFLILLMIFPLLFLMVSTITPVFIIAAGYYAGLVSAKIAFLKRANAKNLQF